VPCLPRNFFADSLYGGDENIQQAKQDYNIDVVVPVMGAKSKGMNLDDFLLDSDGKIIVYPQGNSPISVERPKDRFIAKFLCSDCRECSESNKS
jgi:hypothetical protein